MFFYNYLMFFSLILKHEIKCNKISLNNKDYLKQSVTNVSNKTSDILAPSSSDTIQFKIINPSHHSFKSNPYKLNDKQNWEKSKSFKENEDNYHDEEGSNHEEKFNKRSGESIKKVYKSDVQYGKGKRSSYDRKYEENDGKDTDNNKHSDDTTQNKDSNDHFIENDSNKRKTYGLKKQHNKGSKSKGYHNLFVKDEYKKDHIFYDSNEEDGYHTKRSNDEIVKKDYDSDFENNESVEASPNDQKKNFIIHQKNNNYRFSILH